MKSPKNYLIALLALTTVGGSILAWQQYGELVELRGIEIYKVNDAGKIISVRAFFEQPTDFELNPFFIPEG